MRRSSWQLYRNRIGKSWCHWRNIVLVVDAAFEHCVDFFRAHLDRPDGLVPPAWHAIFTNRFSVHASFEASFQSAELAAIALLSRHQAHFVPRTAVHAAVADRALEEAFASFAADDSVVKASRSVAADSTLLFAIPRADVRLV